MNRQDPRYEFMTLDEFEEMLPDKPSDEKWELIGGRVIRMMVGARWEHSKICGNLAFALEAHVRNRRLPCNVFRETFWLKQQAQDLAVFPDIQIHCGPLAPGQSSVDDPVVLAEVVSKGSSFRDRIEKKARYEKLLSVAHIVFVSLDRREVEVLTRKDAVLWESEILEADATLRLSGLSFEMPVAEIYRGLDGLVGDRAT